MSTIFIEKRIKNAQYVGQIMGIADTTTVYYAKNCI